MREPRIRLPWASKSSLRSIFSLGTLGTKHLYSALGSSLSPPRLPKTPQDFDQWNLLSPAYYNGDPKLSNLICLGY
ncbi:unnamed protein product [Penicillium camemberti]|uniref:Str. FM013 n=1 Tax=Penicillium camemberti (strain FM 013) TaxID=1429867 RepID=A0A0G4NT40_PENC3|nr:unnamed protein product [Penicillium camemberti]